MKSEETPAGRVHIAPGGGSDGPSPDVDEYHERPRAERRKLQGRVDRPRRPSARRHQQKHLRPLRRTPRASDLRRPVGRRGLKHPEHARAFATTCWPRSKRLNVPVLRWPGGCFADEYHWRDGIGPRDKRPRRPNASWGGVDTNAFGTHEFLDLCELLGAEPYVNGNLGSRHAAGDDGVDRVHDLRLRLHAREPAPTERAREALEDSVLRRRQRELGLRRRDAPGVSTPTSTGATRPSSRTTRVTTFRSSRSARTTTTTSGLKC